MRPLLRPVLVVFAVLAITGAIYFVFRPAPILVEVAPVARGRFVSMVEDDGRTRVRDRYVISAPVAGRLLRLQALRAIKCQRTKLLRPSFLRCPRCSTRERAAKPKSASERRRRSCRKPHRRLSV